MVEGLVVWAALLLLLRLLLLVLWQQRSVLVVVQQQQQLSGVSATSRNQSRQAATLMLARQPVGLLLW
jgi:hypothetical protein